MFYIEQVQVFAPNLMLGGPFDTKEEAESWANKHLPKSWRTLDFLITEESDEHETRYGTLVPWGGAQPVDEET